MSQAVSTTALVIDGLPPISRCLLAVCDPRLRLDCAAAAGEPPEALVASHLPDARTRLLRALADVRDWPRLRAAAVQQGLAGLFGAQLLALAGAEAGGGVLPDSERSEWRALSRAVTARSLRMTAVLVKVLAELDRAGVRALPYKGPALAQQLYGDPCLRHYVDLDVVVAPGDVQRALDCLQAVGWQAEQPIRTVGAAAYMAAEQEVSLSSACNETTLDLHWRIGRRFVADSLPAGDVLRRAHVGELLGRPVLMPDQVDVALVMAVHAANHDWRLLEAVAALAAAFAALDDQGWRVLARRASAYGCRRRVGVAVALVRDLACVGVSWGGAPFVDAATERTAARARAHLLASLGHSGVGRGGDGGASPPTRRERAADAFWQASALDTPRAVAVNMYCRLTAPGRRDWSQPGATHGDGDGRLPLWLRRQLRIWRR